ncbi:hypothetical protein N665_0383s0213 [Sinapis alba]|nr:hypothetical protein N665_0383s0213 [Sinapis alba]
MRRGNHRVKAAETLKNPSTSRDMKKRKRSVDVDRHRNDHGPSIDAKTSEFAFFNKLKSSFGLSVKQNPRAGGTDTDKCNSFSFSTPIFNNASCALSPVKKRSSGFNRDNDNLSCGGGSSDDLFSVKRKRLNQWVKDTWFPVYSEGSHSLTGDLVSLLLTRLFPPSSRFPKDRTDRRTFLDSPGSKFLHESYTEVDHSLQMEKKNRSRGWLENSIAPSLQFPRNNVLIPRYPKEWVVYTQKATFPVEETLDSSLHLGNYKSLSLGEEIGYSLPHDHREPSSALLLEWNTSTRKTNDLQPSNHTELITCPNASPSLADYSSSHDVATREPCSLPLPSHYTSGSFLLPATNQTSHFSHGFERHITKDEDMVAANQNLQTFHHGTSSSDCLNRDYTYCYHSPSSSPLDHSPFKVPGRREMLSFPFSSISNSDLLEASSPTTQSNRWWI